MPVSPGPEASMGPAEIVKLALQMSIMRTVFGFGLRSTVEDALYLVRHPRMLVISLVSMLIVMPFIALALVLVFGPPQLARVALALSPVPPILLTRQRKAGGQAAYGLGLTAAVSILSVVLVPALVAFLGRLMDSPYELGPAAVAGQVVVAVVLPLAAGMPVRAVLPRVADRLEKPVALVANVVLAAAAVVVLAAAFPRLAPGLHCRHRRGHYRPYGAGAGLRPHFGRTGPWGFCGAGSRQRCPAAGHRLAVAGANVPSLDVGAVIILYLLIGGVVCIPYAKRMLEPCRLRPRSVRSAGAAAGVPGCRGLAGSPGLLHAGILRGGPAQSPRAGRTC
jgi:BASS family bile acid:Na+ symporter